MIVFIGTYTNTTSKGIYALRFDGEKGTLTPAWLAGEGLNPTFVAFDSTRKHLYSTGEMRLDPPSAKPVGGISAFLVDSESGRLSLLNRQATGGPSTTHVVVDATDKMVVAANYTGAYVCALPVEQDGSLGARGVLIEHQGPLGPDTDRQKQAHAHSVTISPDNRFVLACDLGLDRIFIYRIDPAKAALMPNDPPFAAAPPGSGPRHSKFSADGKFFYVANEMGGSVCVFSWNSARGALTMRQTISTLPSDFHELNTVGEIRIAANQRFVYVSNRGHESIAVFSRDPVEGTLRRVEIVPCGGQHPRNFALTQDGCWLLCANRDTDNVVLLRVDAESGRLTKTGAEATVPRPVCVLLDE